MLVKRLLFAFIAFCIPLTVVRAEYFIIKSYQINVNFTEEGYADFDEVIEVEFSEPRHGIFRAIPIRSVVDGKTVDRKLKNIDVDGYKFSTSHSNNNLIIKIGDKDVYVDGRQVYRIHYRVLNPFNFFEDHTELYWDLLGISWPVPIESCTFSLTFPDRVTLSTDDVYAYTGAAGSQGKDVTLEVQDHRISGNTTRRFNPEEGITVAVRLNKDAFAAMDWWTYMKEVHSLLLAPILFLFGGFLAMFMARNKRQTIMTEYFPPKGISPAIAGGFVDDSVDNNDVLCLIPHLANMGYLSMEATEGKGFMKKDQITFHKLKEAGSDLMPFESQFFHALFETGGSVQLKSLKDKFYVHMSAIKSAVKQWIRDQGWYESDQRAMGCVTALAGLVAIGWGVYVIAAKQNMDGIALGVAGLVLFYVASRFNKRTAAGNETYRKLEGFRQFVAKAERPVIERMLKEDPLYYDKTMPFALAFGYLKKWNKLFDGLLSEPPSWYVSPYMHGSSLTDSWHSFSESFPSEINQVGSVFNSAPSSSGSGGGGGGGFSGGGSGGGGGGSW